MYSSIRLRSETNVRIHEKDGNHAAVMREGSTALWVMQLHHLVGISVNSVRENRLIKSLLLIH